MSFQIEDFESLDDGKVHCEGCGYLLADGSGETDMGVMACRADCCWIMYCPQCRHQVASMGPVGCWACNYPYRSREESRRRRAWSLRRRPRRFRR